MKKYSLLRFGLSGDIANEPYRVAIEEDDVFTGFADVYRDYDTKEITVVEHGKTYLDLPMDQMDASFGTDAEGAYALGTEVAEGVTVYGIENPDDRTPSRRNPFRLSSLAEVIEVAEGEIDDHYARLIARHPERYEL